VLEIILIVGKCLSSVERRIDVYELDLAHVLFSQFWHSDENFEDVAGLSKDEQVILTRFEVSSFRVFELVSLS